MKEKTLCLWICTVLDAIILKGLKAKRVNRHAESGWRGAVTQLFIMADMSRYISKQQIEWVVWTIKYSYS